jgi:16S rRNA (cytosine967-C5)-methyltransferase
MPLDVRAAAAAVIGDVLGGASLNQALPQRLEQVRHADRGLLQQLCYGTLREGPRLQALLKLLIEKPLRGKDRDLQGLLLCGLYQLDHTRVPDHAAVAETVEATRVMKKHWAGGLANAVLRRYLREREQLSKSLDPAAAACHPPWLYNKILSQWPQDALAILEAGNQQPPMTLRTNARQVCANDYLARLRDLDVEAAPGALSAYAVRLMRPMDVLELPGFAEGQVSVQDEAAQMAAILLQPAAGERVLDACAAPGGKTCHLLELQPDLAELVAMDIHASRLEKVEQNLRRLGLHATLLKGDAAHPPTVLAPCSFDRILADVPCSASGVIRRHPDIKLLRRESDIPPLAALQAEILRGLWPLLKPGGTMLYATCSILDEENSRVVRQFLATQSDAQLLENGVTWGTAAECGRQLLPSAGGADGMFYALLGKSREIPA